MRRSRRLHAITFVVVLASIGSVAHAQTRAAGTDLAGTVRDESKAVVTGATVAATNLATGLQRTALSQQDGRYAIPALPPGDYTVTAYAPASSPRLRAT